MRRPNRPNSAIAALVLLGLRGALAQEPEAMCNWGSSYGWAVNSLGQDPCMVANDLFSTVPGPCSDSNIVFQSLNGGIGYTGSAALAFYANTCICNTVIYSLAAACSLCQGASLISWSTWTAYCAGTQTVYQKWPAAIPSSISIPLWAYMAINGSWDSTAAKNNASVTAQSQLSRRQNRLPVLAQL
ncbi:hypothetical protein BV22DRAFT_489581 [Leucogyrophana mollusca]|uniref:Uncharacterized protein n=1 Tax=Leucogyrophana mollusca TaxID=85980 RepID=A0ACB8BH02_9AGAM|nr:hypothetical protein BV22DRAFT_489581 [Leucogyrophana mollusca]